ncbi:hypothetical protein MATL_G00019340 [Megalops atlanticus]|uniref:RRM domain-containing protein n=1 Tax=Megalops atlanticus TaxID=7932 RepID=A0A9D3TKD1_MEGAT|nr:hypothetical protein MATL_G00019340 [Megalops atlanticus]
MKKKATGNSARNGASVAAEQSGEYVVGQVCSSLFPNKSTSDSGSLSALFKTESSGASLSFVPAPKPLPKSTETSSGDSGSTGQKVQTPKKKADKEKSAAEKTLENRESALQNADEEDSIRKTSKKTKRKAAGAGEAGLQVEEEPAQKKKAINKAEERIKNKRTVFVGNLPVSCTKKTLQILFKEYGSIESVRFRSVTREDASMSRKVAAIQRKIHPKRQSINAYVVFKAEEAAMNALKRNGLEIEKGFHIRVDRASKSSSHDHKRSIFVGNLPYDISELPLRKHFEECGGVEAVRLVRDRNTGMGKGFGYILFESIDAVQLALKLDASELEGRKIRVKRSVKKEKLKNVAPGKGPRPGASKGQSKEGAGKGSRTTMGPPDRGQKKAFKARPGQGPQKKTSQHRLGKPHGGSSFKGEMAKPGSEKPKQSKGLKKKFKPRKKGQTVHI